ncbi:hypothetical protein [Nocardia pseudobrasiliensis]|uniref:hypothetical protein n=1 Tax=Nocardia pseudobrasiliensis TaxID=45979 RepID=UPI0012E73A52|nr:hypothetical protein [Nocardia pseudobrasiliensis]
MTPRQVRTVITVCCNGFDTLSPAGSEAGDRRRRRRPNNPMKTFFIAYILM